MRLRPQNFQKEAIKTAYKSKFKKRLGAIVVNENRIVGRGFNYAHGTGQVYGDGSHAEISALNNTTARYRNGATLYVARIGRAGELRISKPCDACFSVMKKMGIKTVWYIDKSEHWRKEKL